MTIAALVGDGSPGPLGLGLFGIVLVAVFALLSRAAAEGNEAARFGAIAQVVALSAAGALALFIAIFLVSLKCDEACQTAGDWWRTEDAWQWWGQFVVAGLGLIALLLGGWLTVERQHREATMTIVAAAVCFAVWTAFLAPLGNELGV
ncbi:MAG: hypothetical protein ACR2FZ_05410 [Thermoleophilaceae bacterium]